MSDARPWGNTKERKLPAKCGGVPLDPWEEVVGTLEEIHRDPPYLLVTIAGTTLAFRAESAEAAIIEDELAEAEGNTVGILRTEFAEQPLRVQVTNGSND